MTHDWLAKSTTTGTGHPDLKQEHNCSCCHDKLKECMNQTVNSVIAQQILYLIQKHSSLKNPYMKYFSMGIFSSFTGSGIISHSISNSVISLIIAQILKTCMHVLRLCNLYMLSSVVLTVHSRAESRTSISSVNTVDDVSMDFERTIAVCEEEVMRAEKGIVGYHV